MKKRKLHYADLSSIPVTPTPNVTGWKSKSEIMAGYREDAERPVKQAVAAIESTYSQLRKLAREFWSRPVDQLQLSIYQDSARDVTFDAPPVVKQSYTRDELIAACDKWHADYFVNSGYVLSESGVLRLCCFGESQARAGADMSQPAAWQAVFDHLRENLKAFAEGELDSSRVPRAEPPAPPQLKISDIENLALESTEGRKQALAIVTELASVEASKVCEAWLLHLQRDYQFSPSPQQIQAVVAWFNRNAKNWLRYESYNECRRFLSQTGEAGFPDLRTNDERLCEMIERESSPLMKMGFHDKRDLKNKIMRLADPA
jgi:hypothetical protein